ncbi:tRNA lysidine(34) synthetase TilS [Parvularcula lutaonensis]|uniref:tRNA(Ile)-lysidine synthase n=1 Tax=Parvularcula lutaonensis TaxID=491923 RepID=A0ABV7MCN6_9PROT|nr:tRNA lysidine(34) synthetase TilS [Parvularcula lutaonensis]GGY51292.1 hypothetical protein GCM10007148_20210 [Parvularcula lutaonensis]
MDWPLPPGEAAAIAVSGGADSFALLHWAWKAGHPVVALTVDHQLRKGSAAEAQAVRTFCSERNIPHETLIWRGEKPSTGIQAAAREARYRLLCQACERMGIEHLLTGHTADDQAETVFMRLRRGAGRGLAGMPAERKIAAGPGELITLHRPMLSVRRALARAYAETQGLPFVDDPSNEDERFERVRVRKLLAELEDRELLTAAALCQTADKHAVNRFADLETQVHWNMPYEKRDGAFEAVHADDDNVLRRAQRAVGAIGPIDPEAITFDEPVLDTPDVRFGAMIVAGVQSGREYVDVVYREPAALLGRADGTPGFEPIPAPPSSKHLYDRRFIVEVPDDAPSGLHLRPLGQLLPRDIATSTLARQRISTLPSLAEGSVLTHLPEQATGAVTEALSGWKQCDSFLSTVSGTFRARSLLAERFSGDVIRY